MQTNGEQNNASSFEHHYSVPDPYGHTRWFSEKKRIESTLALLLTQGIRFRRGLELACGEGDITFELMKISEELLAVDISENALSRARVRNQCWGNRVQFIRANWYQMEFDKESFDFISIMEALHYAQDRERQVTRVITWLKPGGYMLFSGANKKPPYYSFDELQTLFMRPELEILRFEPVNTKFPTQYLQNRNILPQREFFWNLGMAATRLYPRLLAKVIAILVRKKIL